MRHPLAAHHSLGATTALVLLAFATSASQAIAQSSGTQEPTGSASSMALPPPPPGDDDDIYRPYVTVTPSGGSTLNPSRSVAIDWCDPESGLTSSTRRITLNGVSVATSFSYVSSSKSGCVGHATSTGTVTLSPDSNKFRAEIKDAAGNLGYRDVVYILAQNPVISTAPHNGDNRDVSRCIADCFDAVMSMEMPAYVTMDAPRSVALAYRSSQASPIATVQVDARDTTSGKVPTRISLKLLDANGAQVTFLGNRQEIFYAYAGGAWQRLAAQFDVSGLATGAYKYTAVVTSYFSDNTMQTSVKPIRVLVTNERSSLLGAGWSFAGIQRLYVQPDGGAVVTDGAGSIAYFSGPCAMTSCSYVSPAGDVTTLSRHSWADNTKFDRRYPDGTVVAFWSNGLIAYVQDRFGNKTSYAHDTSNRLTAITDPTGTHQILISYVPSTSTGAKPNSLYKIEHSDGGSGLTRWFYVNSTTGDLDQIHNSTYVVNLRPDYDSFHRLEHWRDRKSGDWDLSYDCWRHLGVRTMPTVTVHGQSVRPVTRQASADGQVAVCESSASGSFAMPAAAVLASSVRASITGATGNVTRYELDRFGSPTRIEEPLGRTTIIKRDAAGRQTYVRSPSGHAKVFTYSGIDLVSVYDSTTTQRVSMTYEPTYHQPTSTSNGVVGTWNYWSGGKLDSTDAGQPGATQRTKLTYETISGRVTGRVATRTDPMGHVTTYRYADTTASGVDRRNLRTVTAATRTTTYGYDAAGRRNYVRTPLGRISRTRYDDFGRVKETVGPLNDTTTYGYDPLYLTSVRDAKGQTYRFTANALGWIERRTDPSGASEVFTFDSAGLVLTHTNRRLQVVSMTYDALGQLASRTADGVTTTFATDPLGRFAAVTNAESTDTTVFDPAGRAIQEISVWPTGQRFVRSSTFDPNGLRTALQIQPWGTSIGYHYDDKLQLDILTDVSGGETRLWYNSDGALRSLRLPTLSGLTMTFEYPATHSTSKIAYSDAAIDGAIGLQYGSNSDGQVVNRIDYSSGSSQEGRRYSYDDAGRLTGYEDYTWTEKIDTCSETGGDVDPVTGGPCFQPSQSYTRGSAAYAYDLVGNRTDHGALTLTGNRLARFAGDTIVYDADGNMVKRWTLAGGGRIDSLVWSSVGELVSVTHNGVTTTFGYDGFGRRVRKSSGGVERRYLHDGSDLLAELDVAGNRVAEYTYYPGLDTPHSVRIWSSGAAATYYFATDDVGSVVGLVNSGNMLVARYEYSPYGELQLASGTVPSPLRFAGREYDEETGLYYFNARYYDPSLGRFISEDPSGIDAGLNLYEYAGGDPVNRVDPSGRSWLSKSLKKLGRWVKKHIPEVSAVLMIASGGFTIQAFWGAFKAMAATAVGSAWAAGFEAAVTGQSFEAAFRRNFNLSAGWLGVGTMASWVSGGFAGAGAESLIQGYVSSNGAFPLTPGGGLTFGSATFLNGSAAGGNLYSATLKRYLTTKLWEHELGHTIQFSFLSVAGNPWGIYTGLGVIGLGAQQFGLPGGCIVENSASALGSGHWEGCR